MTDTELYREQGLMTDREAQNCLQALLRDYASTAEMRKFVGTEEALAETLREAAPEQVPANLSEAAGRDPAKAVRAILDQVAQPGHPAHEKLVTWVQTKRATLVDPVTAALVMAGIIFVLSLDIKVEVKDGVPALRSG